MKVLFSSTWLASGGREGTDGANWNGQQINDEAQFFRAAAATFYARGGRTTTFGFRVSRIFDTNADALLFAALHMPSLPQQADLFVTDEDDTVSVGLLGAVLESVAVSPVIGCSLSVAYQFRGGIFTSEDVPPGGDVVKRGYVDLAVNDESKDVAFATAFAGVPTFIATKVVPPSASASVPFIDSVPLLDTFAAGGFTAKIGFPIPETGYRLYWEAVGP